MCALASDSPTLRGLGQTKGPRGIERQETVFLRVVADGQDDVGLGRQEGRSNGRTCVKIAQNESLVYHIGIFSSDISRQAVRNPKKADRLSSGACLRR